MDTRKGREIRDEEQVVEKLNIGCLFVFVEFREGLERGGAQGSGAIFFECHGYLQIVGPDAERMLDLALKASCDIGVFAVVVFERVADEMESCWFVVWDTHLLHLCFVNLNVNLNVKS